MFKCKQSNQRCPENRFHEKFYAKLRMLHNKHTHYHQKEFQKYHRYVRYFRPAVLLFNILLLYLLFSWVGFQGLGIFFAMIIIIKEIFQFIFLMRLEKRILTPVEKLRQGVDEIANGNYNVKIEYDVPNDLGLLIFSFNEMAQQLYESEKIQTEYEENRKTLIANISHDLKTPITAIQGYIEALLEGKIQSPADKEKYLRTIFNNSFYINRLIDDLFLFSKLDMQKLDFCFEPVPIKAFMNDLMEEYKFDLEEKGIHFCYISSLEQDYRVNLDGKRLRQAIANIISNAVKHGVVSNLSIAIALYVNNENICLDIKDNGPGIPADKLPYIFDRFYRIDTERTKDYINTGLGLAIAKELVEAHGGAIAVNSRENAETCFTITLPVENSSEEDSGK